MPKLSELDFSFHKQNISDDRKKHTAEMMVLNIPEVVIAAYEGLMLRDIDGLAGHGAHHQGTHSHELQDEIENFVFTTTETILPSLFYQVPRPTIRANPGGTDFSAELLNGLARHYFGDKAKAENQQCVIDAFLPYGYAVMKVGYNSRVGKVKTKVNAFTGTTQGSDASSMEVEKQFLMFENVLLQRESPRTTLLDSSKPFGKGRRITFHYNRTLAELIESNLYNLDARFIQAFTNKSGKNDKRLTKLVLKEHWTMQKDGFAWKLVYTDEWQDPLFWGRSRYTEIPVSLLRFNKPPDRLYPISHGRLMQKAQHKLSYLTAIWDRYIDTLKNQRIVDVTGLNEAGIKALHANNIGATIEANRPVNTGIHANLDSASLPVELFGNIENVRNMLKLFGSATGGRGGDSDVDFAETEKNQATGDIIRASGMQDNIRDFYRDQLRKVTINLVNFGSPELTVKITGKDVEDADGELVTGKFFQFGLDKKKLNFKDEIEGDASIDYKYDVDMASAVRPDLPVIRKQLSDFLTIVNTPEIKQQMALEGKQISTTDLVEAIIDTFEAIPNATKFIRDVTPEDQAQLQAIQGGAPGAPQGAVPSNASIKRSATNIPVATGTGAPV